MDYLNDMINLYIDDYEGKLKNAVNYAIGEFANIRAGRVNPQMVEKITVEYYGTPTILRDLATITNEDARTLIVSPWDISVRPEVCKALAAANMGANPIDNGQYIRMIFPQLTEERRKDLCKQVKVLAENTRVIMRNERRDAIDKVRKTAKTDKIGEDDVKNIEADVQKMLDSYIASLDKFAAKKEAEIMEV
jgi:ribosome recycling factor